MFSQGCPQHLTKRHGHTLLKSRLRGSNVWSTTRCARCRS